MATILGVKLYDGITISEFFNLKIKQIMDNFHINTIELLYKKIYEYKYVLFIKDELIKESESLIDFVISTIIFTCHYENDYITNEEHEQMVLFINELNQYQSYNNALQICKEYDIIHDNIINRRVKI